MSSLEHADTVGVHQIKYFDFHIEMAKYVQSE